MTRTFGARFLAIFALACLIGVSGFAQANAKKKSYTLHGVIQAVKGSEKKVTVKHDKIEGYMGAMTMDYKVADDAMMKKLKAGDEITATLYQDDYTLYDIRLTQIDDRVQ
ncbi:MAG TPA: copper-binding protein [Bryobacteraceae bacterium]|jgi:Cu/Ag efflux protein CusF